jgi:hypothetical protein
MTSSLLHRLLRASLRQELSCFVEKAFNTLEPGTAYQHNWHVDHLCWQRLVRTRDETNALRFKIRCPKPPLLAGHE